MSADNEILVLKTTDDFYVVMEIRGCPGTSDYDNVVDCYTDDVYGIHRTEDEALKCANETFEDFSECGHVVEYGITYHESTKWSLNALLFSPKPIPHWDDRHGLTVHGLASFLTRVAKPDAMVTFEGKRIDHLGRLWKKLNVFELADNVETVHDDDPEIEKELEPIRACFRPFKASEKRREEWTLETPSKQALFIANKISLAVHNMPDGLTRNEKDERVWQEIMELLELFDNFAKETW